MDIETLRILEKYHRNFEICTKKNLVFFGQLTYLLWIQIFDVKENPYIYLSENLFQDIEIKRALVRADQYRL